MLHLVCLFSVFWSWGIVPGSADLAGIGFFASVDEHVRAEMCDLDEARRACVAFVGLLAGMDAEMRLQICRPVELRVADRTLVRLHS